MLEVSLITAVPLLTLLGVATFIDLRSHLIPNAFSLGGAVVGLIVQGSIAGPAGILAGCAGFVLCLVCFLPFYVSGGMAAGDVKLMATVGAFLGPLAGLAACFSTLIIGSVIALACLVHASAIRSLAGDVAAARTTDPGARIPYAGAIAAGTFGVVALSGAGITTGAF